MAGDLDFQLLFEHAPVLLMVIEPTEYRIVGATDAYLRATLAKRDQAIGKRLFDVFPDNPDDPAASGTRALRASLDRVVATHQPDTMAVQKYDVARPDGSFEEKYWSPVNSPVLSPTGQLLHIIHRAEDVTQFAQRADVMQNEILRRNQELHDANAQLAELDHAKTAFFHQVSHELRTPLTLVLGPLEDLVTDPTLTPGVRDRLVGTHRNALRLLKLVNTVLDFTRAEAGTAPARQHVDVAALTGELASMFRAAVERAHLRFDVECPTEPVVAFLDPLHWERIVLNLVSNALKHTFEGAITVVLRVEPSELVLRVTDTGIGIAPEQQARVFERFHRVEGARARSHEGTGIGLALVKQLAAAQGGTISLTSTVGTGSTFEVRLPRVAGDVTGTVREHAQLARPYIEESLQWVPDETPIVAPARSGGRVLVVDDNPDLRAYVSRLLAPYYEVETAVDGAVALAMIEKHAPDLVISDVMMPNLDGLGLVARLRANPELATLPVILLSARAEGDSPSQGIEAGADDFVSKPFTARELLARVRTHLELAAARRAWADELLRMNKELETFSYSVSHDLRAPLRAIDGFSLALLTDLPLEGTPKHYLERIRAATQRMSQLIDDLLRFSRTTRAALEKQPMDLSATATAIVDELRRRHPERTVEVDIAPNLRAQVDRALVRIVLENLLENAWKYTSKTEHARIELTTEGDTIVLRDNGAGFDMDYADKLFAPFQRLHSDSEFPGTGIGLATVQRILARHGGHIAADAAPGKGATFRFSLGGPLG